MTTRAAQKLQTRNALMDAAHLLMSDGRGFGSLSLREITRNAGIVPAGFYRHFSDMNAFGLALVAEVGDTFRDTLRRVRHHEVELQGVIEASVGIFLDAVAEHHRHFLFLAREQYGGSHPIRQAIADLRQHITDDLAADLFQLNRLPHLTRQDLDVVADLVVKTVFATLPELIDTPSAVTAPHLTPQAKIIHQLRFVMIGAKHWHGMDTFSAPSKCIETPTASSVHHKAAN
ncbi:TetR family transcriptional regulator [Pseudomonas duriflava]|uniref:TetR family transcriptional regulator n=1 Tax=Pseudomonas duriflava TaxID=459528 RepID=A0A562Q6I1_9PSED|nr:TetR family transcriptional regulator [Pseudomonas duriflava]TWI52333.1 TetR family transcriptional regulator [Pseudomonas duriflava]